MMNLIFSVFMFHGAKPWVTDFKHPQYQAAARSIQKG